MRILLILLFAVLVHAAPPGIVVDYSPASSGLYIGSPSIAILPTGEYLASHDLFGPNSNEFIAPSTVVFRSEDRGRTWQKTVSLRSLFWAGLFVHKGAVYIMGTDRHHGRIVIRRSRDRGDTWSEPTDASHGQLTERADYHTAPTPVVEFGGRIWRGFEDASGGTKWGMRYLAMMLSISSDADLLEAKNWTFSTPAPRNPAWLEGQFNAWLEGNAVVSPGKTLVNILRVDVAKFPEKAALVSVSTDGKNQTFSASQDIVDFPGGAKKFTIRFDETSGTYWSLVSAVPKEFESTASRA